MKALFQKFPSLIIYLLTSAVLFVLLFFTFSNQGAGGEYTYENLSHEYACSADEAFDSSVAWAIMLQIVAQAVLIPAAILMHVIHWALRKKFSFFDEHPYWSVLLLFVLFIVLIFFTIFLLDFINEINPPGRTYYFSS